MSKSSEPTQVSEGIYVYCIIESPEPRTFGKIGIGGRGDDVYTIHHKELAAVVSRTPLRYADALGLSPARHGALGTGGSTLEPVATRSRQQQERG